ncbi:hypothetical protein LTR08_003239 [Meristemomyces frigidus]|nr:hypothetical protein LTR08_003239 [Meristemomyces frigidus]
MPIKLNPTPSRLPYRHFLGPSTRPARHFSSTCAPHLSRADLTLSDPSAAQRIVREATALVEGEGAKWHLSAHGAGLERPFRFKTFGATWAFMSEVAEECKRQRHHPEWMNVYTRTEIRWTTHEPRGLGVKDLAMARFCDECGARHGEV